MERIMIPYNHSDPKLEGKLQLHYMDCDSFVLSIETDDFGKTSGKLQLGFGEPFQFSNLVLKNTLRVFPEVKSFWENQK